MCERLPQFPLQKSRLVAAALNPVLQATAALISSNAHSLSDCGTVGDHTFFIPFLSCTL